MKAKRVDSEKRGGTWAIGARVPLLFRLQMCAFLVLALTVPLAAIIPSGVKDHTDRAAGRG